MFYDFAYYFAQGFHLAASILAYLLGILAAVAVPVAMVVFAGAAFDQLTSHIAKRWIRSGVEPKSKAARVILAHYKRHGEV